MSVAIFDSKYFDSGEATQNLYCMHIMWPRLKIVMNSCENYEDTFQVNLDYFSCFRNASYFREKCRDKKQDAR